MKIMHLCKKYPQAMGGDAVVVFNLQKQQQAAGHDVVIVTSNCDEIDNAEHLYKFGLKDTPARLDTITCTRIFSLIMLFFRMFGLLRTERPDVLHTHSIDMAFVASFAARFYGVPVIHTFHIVTFYDDTQPAARRLTEMWLARKAKFHTVTTPNKYDVEKLRAAGLSQTMLLPNGVDVEFWRVQSSVKTSYDAMFLSVGRLEHQKGYEYLIKAAALLHYSVSSQPFRVVIVGEGSQEKMLRELIDALHVGHIVSLVGRKSPEEIKRLFEKTTAAVFPSLYETTPVTMLEAWAAGVPVIVTPVGIVRDAPAHFMGASIVPLKDEQSLMHGMNLWMKDAALRLKVAAKGHEEVQKYAWPLVAQTAEVLYQGVR